MELQDTCTLSDDQLTQRIAELRRDVIPHLQHTEKLANGYVLKLRETAGLKDKVKRLIALEEECCQGQLQFDLSVPPQSGYLRLEIHGLDPSSDTLEKLLSDIGSIRIKVPKPR